MPKNLLIAAFLAPIVVILSILFMVRWVAPLASRPRATSPSPAKSAPFARSDEPSNSSVSVTTPPQIPQNSSPNVSSSISPVTVNTDESSQARIVLGQQTLLSEANQFGNFPRIDVGPKQVVSVGVSFPKGEIGDSVVLEVEDGGHIDQDLGSKVVSLDASKTVNFQFQTTEQLGIYRVALRRAGEQKVVNLWVN